MNQTNSAPTEPITTTQRQPSKPNGAVRHQQVGEQGDDRHDGELDHLVVGEGAAADVLGHQLGDVGVDGDQLDADADAGDQAPEADAEAAGLERHDQRGGAVEQQREGEDRAPAVFVGDEAEDEGADEQAGEGGGDEQRPGR